MSKRYFDEPIERKKQKILPLEEEYYYNPDGTRTYINSNRNQEKTARQDTTNTDPKKPQKQRQNEWTLPWSRDNDKAFFTGDEARILKYSTEYFEFEKFYSKFLIHRKRANQAELPEHELIKEALEHFDRFLSEQRAKKNLEISTVRKSLPVYQFKQEILNAVNKNQVTIIAADTGAGKSTQVPQYLLEEGYTNVGCTQPRRIACISLAKRVSTEVEASMKGGIGGSDLVGYKIRFEGSQRKDRTKLMFVTEGILLRQLSGDPLLSMYNCLIIDEVHERHAMGDFILGVMKTVLAQRTDLKLILMSATINAELFSSYFGNAPLITVPGKTYPVEIEYWPLNEVDENLTDDRLYEERKNAEYKQSLPVSKKIAKFNPKPYVDVMKLIDSKYPLETSGKGDLLIFLSGMQEIQYLEEEIKKYNQEVRQWIVLKLHSTLSIQKQDMVFDYAPRGMRKCILSTNIAETSVTIDGIRFVIDSGRVKEIDYDVNCQLSKLSEFWVSKASAKQRAGRAGRTGPGRCFRLYSENEHNKLNDFSVPELLRSPLDQIILQMKSLSITSRVNPRFFEYIEKPPSANIEFALTLLKRLDALDDEENLTILGHTLSLLPMDAVLAKMLILGGVLGVPEPMIVIAAGLSVQNPMLQSKDITTEDNEWKMLRNEIESKNGDPFTLLQLFQYWLKAKNDGENTRVWSIRLGVEEQRLYEMVKLVEQFSLICKKVGFDVKGSKSRGTTLMYHRKKHVQFGSKQSKELKPDLLDEEKKDFDEEPEDLHAMEFDAKIDAESLYSRISSFVPSKLSAVEQQILQLILSSGLYPNLAIPDEGNSTRRIQDYVYHTRFKKFVLIHPSSVYCTHPDYLESSRVSKIIEHSTIKSQQELSLAAAGEVDIRNSTNAVAKENKVKEELVTPEFLCYLQLMETSKPFLMNNFSVPSIACLLYGGHIDTNGDLSFISVDDYFAISIKSKNRFKGKELETNDPVKNVMSDVLRKVVLIRGLWNQALNEHLMSNNREGSAYPPIGKEVKQSKELKGLLPVGLRRINFDFLSHKNLVNFLEEFLSIGKILDRNNLYYEVDILRDADIKTIFPDVEDYKLSVKGLVKKGKKVGIPVTSYLSYGTVHHPYAFFKQENLEIDSKITPAVQIGTSSQAKTVMTCEKCKQSKMWNPVDFEAHVAFCKGPIEVIAEVKEEKKPDKPDIVIAKPPSSSTKKLQCNLCNTIFKSPIELLRHKKTCPLR